MVRRFVQAGLLLVVAACGSTTPTTAQPAGTSGGRPFTTTEVATFDAPWAMSFLPGSGVPLTKMALVTEKSGKLWLVDTANGQKREVAGVPAVVAEGQGGLLDVVAAPSFAGDQMVYFTFAEASQNGGSQLALARARLALQGAPSLQQVQVIWRNPTGGRGGHFGARIAFAPDGQSLFLAAGDRQRFTPAQDVNQPLGKILHLTLDGKPAADNPWAGRTGAATVQVTDPPRDSEQAKTAQGRPVTWPGPNLTPAETWTLGHRNPLGLAFAPDGRLWVAEMGPKGGDELNLIVKGRNYGYPRVSNGDNYNGVPIPDHKPGDGFEAPKLTWTPVVSPGGLLIYNGDLFSQWKGDALIAGLSGQRLERVDLDGETARKAEQWDMGKRIRAIAQGPRGEVYVLEDEDGARLLRLEPARR
ncbi:PQQ-dependent sugar dehydrogenase [Sphingomonas lutea]|uniref:PQQ-dependent sugar dehydrogenase n=1 Tax=Sphingomonas lutea TaxID=1045317 RepID=A0A7G9SGX5_9SPHN|nr:PQQ-dependent sugar dehydrogenase [Sphingomonas lutea]QNN67100.1 PQQ-dependent sugar dehydrogenase [Sphingomonas lutea]